MHATRSPFRLLVLAVLLAVVAVACVSGQTPATPRPEPGTEDAPREVNIVAKDYLFLPSVLDLVPGETVLLHVINGGLEVHEAIIGDASVQEAWAVAEAETEGAPPGPTPVVSVPPDVAGLRIVVESGQLIDVLWTVPPEAPDGPTPWVVGCHIPGHWDRGMQIPIRWLSDMSD